MDASKVRASEVIEMDSPAGLRRHFYPHGDLRPKVLLGMIRTQRFVQMRWAIAAALLLLYGVERLFRPGFTRPPEVAYCAIFLMAINLAWTWVGNRLRGSTGDQEKERDRLMRVVWFVNAQMIADLLVLTVLVRFSGGIDNPMIIFYLFHMLIAALLLRPLNATLQGCWALLLFGGLAAGEYFGVIAPHYPFLPYATPNGPHLDWEHVLVVTATLAIGVFGILYFTLRISFGLDEQERRLHAAMEEAERNRQALQDLQARRARFMQTAAHQLKSPLAGVQTLAGLIRDGVVPPEEARSVSERIVRRSREGITQVGELLALARIQQADVRALFGSTCDAGAVVRDLAARHAPIAAEKAIALSCEIDEAADFTLHLESGAVRDCVGNLIENAIKYTPNGGKVAVRAGKGTLRECVADLGADAELSIRLPDAGRFVVVSVTDTGMGIEPEALAGVKGGAVTGSIFDAFLRGNQALESQIPGSGLGLAIVHEIMEQVGGYIIVQSQLQRGSTFTLAFPCQTPALERGFVKDTRSTILVLETSENRGGAISRGLDRESL